MMAIEKSNLLTVDSIERKPLVKQGSSRARRPKVKRSVSTVKRQFRYREPVCPFIASTFLDFQAERDILVKKVFPAIDALCRERGTYCAPIDLRWGINETQVSSNLVIQSCLDYVRRCSPYFLCLVGERYGSHRMDDAPPLPPTYSQLPPDADWLDRNFLVAASGGYDWVLQDSYQHCSVTELEIMQAAFLEVSETALFYFRTPDHVDNLFTDLPESERQERLRVYEAEDEFSQQKLRNLKDKIINRGLPVKYFKTPEDLARIVLEDWTRIINRFFPPLEDMVNELYADNFAEWMAHETYAETRRRAFVKSSKIDGIFQKLTDFACTSLDQHDEPESQLSRREMFALHKYNIKKQVCVKYQSVLTLVGDRGCGKTAVVANWIKQFSEENPGVTVFSHYVGSSCVSVDIGHLLRRCAKEVRGDYQPPGSCDESDSGTAEEMLDFYHITESFQAAISMGPCVLVIDGIDELTDSCGLSAQQVKAMSWLPQPLPPYCKVVVTTVKSDATYKSLSQRADNQTITIPLLGDVDTRSKIIGEHLAMHCKALDSRQLERIVHCKLSERPLFLTTLANELRVFGVYSSLDYHLDSYLEATSIRDLWSRIIKRWIKDYSWTTQNDDNASDSSDIELTGWVADALRLIAVSRNGLGQSEILGVLEQIGYQGGSRVTSFDWALFRSAALDALFERPGGLLTFFHQHFKEAVEHTLLGAVTPDQPGLRMFVPVTNLPEGLQRSDPNRSQYHRYTANYFLTQPHSERRCEELPWHLDMCDDLELLCQVLSEPKMFMAFQSDGGGMGCKRLDLTRYWTRLKAGGFDPCVAYAGMIYAAAGKEPPLTLNYDDDNDDDVQSNVTCSSDLEADEKEISMTEVDETIQLEKEIPLRSAPPDVIKEEKAPPTEVSPEVQTGEETKHDEVKPDESEEKKDTQSPEDSRRSSIASTKLAAAKARQDSIDLAQLCTHVGQFLSEMGYFSQAENMLIQAHKNLEEKYPLEDEEQWLLYIIEENLANMYRFQLKKPEAFKWYTRALDTIDELINGLDSEEFDKYIEAKGRILDHMGNMKTYDRSYGAAEKMLRRAEECMLECGSNLGKATVQHHMGILRMRQRNFLEAETYLRQALLAREGWYGKSHPHVADVLNDLAGLLSFPENIDSYDKFEADMLYTRAMHIREQSLGPDHLLLATTLFHLGRLKMREDSTPTKKEALDLLKRALNIRIQKLGSDHHLCSAVRKTIKQLETNFKSKQVRGHQQQQQGKKGPFSSLSWHDHDLMLMKRSQSLRQQPTLPKGFNPGRRTSLQRQDAYRTQTSREDPPPLPLMVEPLLESPVAQTEEKPKPTASGKGLFTREQSIGESVLQFVELPNYEPSHVTPRSSYSSSPKGSPAPGRRTSLGRDILKLALHKVTVEIDDMLLENASDSDENQNVKAHVDRNDTAQDDYIDTYSTDTKEISRPKTANAETSNKTRLESRPKTAPNVIIRLKRRQSSKDSKAVVRFRHPERAKSSEDLGGNSASVWHTNSTPVTPTRYQGFTPIVAQKKRTQSAGALNESGRGQLLRSPTSPIKTRPCSSDRTRKQNTVTYEIHRSKCYIPGPHTIDLHNAYSVTPGPHSAVRSLMGDPPCPRPTFQYHHGSAWYQIPGRSPLDTTAQLHPKRRSHSASSVSVNGLDPVGWNSDQNRTKMFQSASWSEGQFNNY